MMAECLWFIRPAIFYQIKKIVEICIFSIFLFFLFLRVSTISDVQHVYNLVFRKLLIIVVVSLTLNITNSWVKNFGVQFLHLMTQK